MGFPQDILTTRVEMVLGGSEVDVTEWVLGRGGGGITIVRGQSDEGTRVDPGRCRLELDNRDGRFSRRNPRGPWFGLLGPNTPVRVSTYAGERRLVVPLGVAGRASTPDTAALGIVGDIDVRVDLAAEEWSGAFTNGAWEIAGKYNSTSPNRSWRMLVNSDGTAEFTWSTAGSTPIIVDSTVPIPAAPGQRLSLRATLDVDNGDGHTITFYTGPPGLAGPWRQLGSPIERPGTTSIYASTAPLEVGDLAAVGFYNAGRDIYAVEVRDGIDGPIVANPIFSEQPEGATSFTDSAGLPWATAGGAAITARRVRFSGEIPEWPVRWSTGGRDAHVPIEAAGILRRLGQGVDPLESTLRRRIPSANPRAYWPMEDERDATQAASPIEGCPAMRVSGLSPASDDSLLGAGALPRLGSASSIAGIVPGAALGGWHLEMVYRLDALPESEQTLIDVGLAGSVAASAQVRVSTGGIRVQVSNLDGDVIASHLYGNAPSLAAFAGPWNRLRLVTSPGSGGTTDVTVGWRDVIDGTGYHGAVNFNGAPGAIRAVRGKWGPDFQGMTIGHIGVWDIGGTAPPSPGVTIYAGADDGFLGENPATRIRRLSGEEGVPVRVIGSVEPSEGLGGQRPGTLLGLLSEVAEMDGGLLYETRDRLELAYRTRSSMYNRQPAVTLVYAGGDGLVAPLDPADDDQGVRNDVTVQRIGGSSAREQRTEGPWGITRAGRYPHSMSLSLRDDGQAGHIAAWVAHLGTWDEERYRAVTVDLAAAPHMIDAVTALDVGSALRIAAPLPEFLPPGDVDLMALGYTETISQFSWAITFNCRPAGPWTVGEVGEAGPEDDGAPAHVDTDGTVLAVAASETTSVLYLKTTVGPEWVTTAGPTGGEAEEGDLPVDLAIGGEVVRVTRIESTGWDVFDRAVTGGWGSTTDGLPWSLSGGSDADRSVTPGAGLVALPPGTATTQRFQLLSPVFDDAEVLLTLSVDQVATGAALTPGVVMRVSGAAYYRVRLILGAGGTISMDVSRAGTVIGAAVPVPYAYAAGGSLRMRVRVDGHRLRAKVWPGQALEPSVWWLDRTVETDPIPVGLLGVVFAAASGNTNSSPTLAVSRWEVVNPQYAEAERAINGVTATHPAGTDVRLAHPMIVPL